MSEIYTSETVDNDLRYVVLDHASLDAAVRHLARAAELPYEALATEQNLRPRGLGRSWRVYAGRDFVGAVTERALV